MPVLVLTAPPLGDDGVEREAIARVTRAVAEALGLPDDAVVVALVHTAPASSTWPVLLCHGRPRSAESMSQALVAARASLATSWRTTADEVWAQWCLADL